jgi:hypothetical protein
MALRVSEHERVRRCMHEVRRYMAANQRRAARSTVLTRPSVHRKVPRCVSPAFPAAG